MFRVIAHKLMGSMPVLLALLVFICHWLSAFTHILLFLVQWLPPAACFSRTGLDALKYLDKGDAPRCLKVDEMTDLGV